jgi:hypothetical protein
VALPRRTVQGLQPDEVFGSIFIHDPITGGFVQLLLGKYYNFTTVPVARGSPERGGLWV